MANKDPLRMSRDDRGATSVRCVVPNYIKKRIAINLDGILSERRSNNGGQALIVSLAMKREWFQGNTPFLQGFSELACVYCTPPPLPQSFSPPRLSRHHSIISSALKESRSFEDFLKICKFFVLMIFYHLLLSDAMVGCIRYGTKTSSQQDSYNSHS